LQLTGSHYWFLSGYEAAGKPAALLCDTSYPTERSVTEAFQEWRLVWSEKSFFTVSMIDCLQTYVLYSPVDRFFIVIKSVSGEESSWASAGWRF
jgi:hypothetical protein